jgi:predicted RNA binding protein YcfA (HicA-like mRNA interferase family)
MEARHLLKTLRDDGWYLGDTKGASRQYVHPAEPHRITVCVRYTDQLGPETVASALAPAHGRPAGQPDIRLESTVSGASAWSPDLPGCVASGADEQDVRRRMAEAVSLHLRGMAPA